MKKKIILIIGILLIIIGIICQLVIPKNKTSNIQKEDDKIILSQVTSHICTKITDWTKFNTTDINGNYLGSYRRTDTFTFDIIDNKDIMNSKYEIKLEFENIDGYSYLSMDGNYEKNFDESKLIKVFTSNKILPISLSDLTNINNSYIYKLTEENI